MVLQYLTTYQGLSGLFPFQCLGRALVNDAGNNVDNPIMEERRELSDAVIKPSPLCSGSLQKLILSLFGFFKSFKSGLTGGSQYLVLDALLE